MKLCSRCNIKKTFGLFYKRSKSLDGYTVWCKLCNKEHKRELSQQRREKGLCHRCGKPPVSGLKMCSRCLNNKSKRDKTEAVRIKNREYIKTYRDSNPSVKIASNLRKRICQALKGKHRCGSAVREMGCSVAELEKHLESQFQSRMSWGNYGKLKGQWSIDHIIPLSTVDLTDREQFLKVCHYTNLRPMWQSENISRNKK